MKTTILRARKRPRLGSLPQAGLALAVVVLAAVSAGAQDNYEIQVYDSETTPPHNLMVELHSNFTVDGSKTIRDGVLPTNHAVHETLEITQGITPWFETALYTFTSIQPDGGWQYVGSHIRPKVRAPDSWHWPVGVSLANEIGYQRRQFSTDTWTWEMRPIVDKKLGRWYLAFNPTVVIALHGPGTTSGPQFSPNVKVSYDFTKKITAGLEYYGGYGPFTDFAVARDQQHQFFPSIDLNLDPKWEVNFGVGVGTTRSTDHLIVKGIIGRRFNWKW